MHRKSPVALGSAHLKLQLKPELLDCDDDDSDNDGDEYCDEDDFNDDGFISNGVSPTTIECHEVKSISAFFNSFLKCPIEASATMSISRTNFPFMR